MSFPDVTTLKLCSILASAAFGLVFLVLWLRNRPARHFAMWSASSLIYGFALVCYALMPHPSLAVSSVLCAILAATNLLPVCGVLALSGKPVVQPWMAVPVACGVIGHGIPSLLTMHGVIGSAMPWQAIGDALGLALAVAIPGMVLAFGAGSEDSTGQRMAGFSMLAYVPAYALSIVSETVAPAHFEFVALYGMLSDQILLGVLNLGLLAIPVEQVQKQLRMAAMVDPLTGCWNRAGLAHLAERSLRPRTTVIAIDVDHFKQVNDRYGHAAGDEVLAFIGVQARELAKAYDGDVVRLGGDEFVIVLPPGHRTSIQFTKALQQSLDVYRVGGASWSVSIGIAQVRADDPMLSEAIARADIALYKAKAARGPELQRSAA